MLKGKLFRLLVAVIVGGAAVYHSALPADTASSVTMSGTAQGRVILSAGAQSASDLVSAPGVTGASFTPATANTEDFTATANFGNLTLGDGTRSELTIRMRQRSNVPVRVTSSVQSYTVSGTITFGTTTLQSGTLSDLTFAEIRQGSTIDTSGARVNPNVGAAYNSSNWPASYGSKNLSNLNASIGSPTSSSAVFVNTQERISTGGGPSASDNFIEDQAVIGIESGLIWGGTGSWTVNLQFEIFNGP